MKLFTKVASVALCFCLATVAFVACGPKKTTNNNIAVNAQTFTFRSLGQNLQPGDAFDGLTVVNTVEYTNGTYTVNVAKDTMLDVVFAKQFQDTHNVFGQGYSYTRKTNGGEAVTGYAYKFTHEQGV
ncbi:MAG: hypothetical protein FWD32_02405, partial [Firmicutes bacterium]|nr:hypothetical protein [Bacillota bacterium]